MGISLNIILILWNIRSSISPNFNQDHRFIQNIFINFIERVTARWSVKREYAWFIKDSWNISSHFTSIDYSYPLGITFIRTIKHHHWKSLIRKPLQLATYLSLLWNISSHRPNYSFTFAHFPPSPVLLRAVCRAWVVCCVFSALLRWLPGLPPPGCRVAGPL